MMCCCVGSIVRCTNKLFDSSVVATRTQLPLMLAYAITIHKSQGMTISLLEVSFRGRFEYGQVVSHSPIHQSISFAFLLVQSWQCRRSRETLACPFVIMESIHK